MVTWPAQLDTKCRYLPTEVVPIYLLTFLHAFEWLGWQELGQATGAHPVAWIRSYNGWSSDLAAQRLLRFNAQRHHVPTDQGVQDFFIERLLLVKACRGSWEKQQELTLLHGVNLTTAGLLTLQHRGFCGLTGSTMSLAL